MRIHRGSTIRIEIVSPHDWSLVVNSWMDLTNDEILGSAPRKFDVLFSGVT